MLRRGSALASVRFIAPAPAASVLALTERVGAYPIHADGDTPPPAPVSRTLVRTASGSSLSGVSRNRSGSVSSSSVHPASRLNRAFVSTMRLALARSSSEVTSHPVTWPPISPKYASWNFFERHDTDRMPQNSRAFSSHWAWTPVVEGGYECRFSASWRRASMGFLLAEARISASREAFPCRCATALSYWPIAISQTMPPSCRAEDPRASAALRARAADVIQGRGK